MNVIFPPFSGDEPLLFRADELGDPLRLDGQLPPLGGSQSWGRLDLDLEPPPTAAPLPLAHDRTVDEHVRERHRRLVATGLLPARVPVELPRVTPEQVLALAEADH